MMAAIRLPPRRLLRTTAVRPIWVPLLTGAAIGAALWTARLALGAARTDAAPPPTSAPATPSPEAPSPPRRASTPAHGIPTPRRSRRRPPLAVDLGTISVRVAVPTMDGGRLASVRVLENADGARATPAWVAVDDDDSGSTVVGAPARRRWLSQPTAAVHGPHHYLGRRADDAAVQALRAQHHARVQAGPQGEALLVLDKRAVHPTEAVAALLVAAREVAQATGTVLDDSVAWAVPSWLPTTALAVPLDQAGLALETAAPDAAAALAGSLYLRGGLDAVLAADGPFLVVDAGATPRATVVLARPGGRLALGRTHAGALLGHLDGPRRIVAHTADLFAREHGINLLDDPLARARLADAAEALQTELATRLSTSLHLPFITANAQGPKHLRNDWTRARYEQLLLPVWDDLEGVVRTVVADHADPTALRADRVVLAGGLGRVPRVAVAVARGAGLAQVPVAAAPEELAVVGAAVLGYLAATGHTVH